VSEIGLFPLGMVLLPGERVPLHIFEERYKELIGECLATGDEFGVVFGDDDGVRSIGTTAAIAEVLQRFDDGRLNIVVEGRRRFAVEEITTGRSFITAEVAGLADEPSVPDEGRTNACLEAFRKLAAAAGLEGEPPEPGGDSLSFSIGAMVGFEPRLKQGLLELRSEAARLERLTEMLEAAAELMVRRSEIERLAAGNGHVTSE
jgi:ATP-dependent Lon protease